MLLTIDIGNTNIVLGFYQKKKLIIHWRIETDRERTEDEYAALMRGLFSIKDLKFDSVKDVRVSCVATPFDAVSQKGEYLGGVITPGIGISMEALFERAAKLPKVELIKPPTVIGRNTISSMQSGAIYGYAGLVDRIVEEMRKELDRDTYVVATGGLAELIIPESLTIKEVNPFLTLDG